MKKERQPKEKPTSTPPLTYEAALSKLLESNQHLDETAAKILLERGLIMKEGRLTFSRDIRIYNDVYILDYVYEFRMMQDEIKSKMQSPIHYIYAWPPYMNVNNFLADVKERSKAPIRVEKFAHSSSHHFHLVKLKETAALLLDFFAKYCN